MSASAAQVRRPTVQVEGAGGWRVTLETLGVPEGGARATVLTVPASKHERDAWGPMLTAALVERGVAVVSMDVRGRGDSREPRSMTSLPPGQLSGVHIDVAAAIDHLATAGPSAGPIIVMCEQDTADPALRAVQGDRRVTGVVMVSPKFAPTTLRTVFDRPVAMCVLASKEDRAGLESACAMYVRSTHPASRFRLVGDVGSGTTMFAAWQYLRTGERTLEQWLAAWVAAAIGPDPSKKGS